MRAEPMTLKEYHRHKKIFVPDDSFLDEPGYIIRYDYGFSLWCPKETFDKSWASN